MNLSVVDSEVRPLDVPLCLSAPPHRIGSPADLPCRQATIVRRLAARLEGTAIAISATVATPHRLHGVVRSLAADVADLAGHSSVDGCLPPRPSADQSRAVLEQHVTHDLLGVRPEAPLAAVVGAFARYDDYFGFRRAESLASHSFVGQVLTTLEAVLDDVPVCLLDPHEIAVLLRAVAAGLSATTDTDTDTDVDVDKGVPAVVVRSDDLMPDQLPRMALRRWKIGHHLFNQLAVMSLQLVEASRATLDPEERARPIARLCRTYRGATAAMWYAQAFPPQLYGDVVRPSMEDTSPDGSGFSGTDSLDFRLMKLRLRRMLDGIEDEVGPVDVWPDSLWSAVGQLYEVQLVDLEHHVLIAEKLVGGAPSLKQARMARAVAGRLDTAGMSAIDALRTMAAERAEAKAAFLAR